MTPWPPVSEFQAMDLDLLGPLKPAEVLYEFEGPCIFVAQTPAAGLVLAYLSEDLEEERVLRYIVASTSRRTVEELKQGVVSVRQAMERGSSWLVDMNYHHVPQAAWVVDVSELPEDALPETDVMLWSSLEPVLTIRLEGPEILEGSVPAAALSQAADIAARAFKPLFEWAARELRTDTSGRPPDWLRQLYAMRTQRVVYGSLEVSFRGIPLEGASQTSLDLPSQERPSLQDIQQAAWTALREGLAWATTNDHALLPDHDQTKSMAMLETLKRLAPAFDGPVTAVQLRGPMLGKMDQQVALDRHAARRIRSAFNGLRQRHEVQLRVFSGRIRELDLDKLTFILRSPDEASGDVSLALEDDRLLEVAREAHYQQLQVSVAARSEDRKSWVATEIAFGGSDDGNQEHDGTGLKA